MSVSTTLSAGSRTRTERPMVVDWAAPLLVIWYLVVAFHPFVEVRELPPIALSGLVPMAAVGLLLLTPTDRIRSMPICLPMIAYVGWNTASLLWSDAPSTTFFALRFVLFPLLAVMAVAATVPRDVLVRTLLSFFLVISAWNAIASLFFPGSGMLAGGGLGESIHGTIGHKNDLGIFAVLALAMVLPLYDGRWRRTIIVVLVVTAMATRSATAGGGLATVLFVWILMMAVSRGHSGRDRQILKFVAATLAVVAVLSTLRLLPVALDFYDKDVTFSGRTMIWAESVKAVAEEPWSGRGLGAVWTLAPTKLRFELWQQIGFPSAHSHNGAIQLLLDVGIIGLGLMIVFLLALGRLAGRATQRPETRAIGRWATLTLTAILVTSFAEPSLGVPWLGLLGLIWVVLASADNERRGSHRLASPTTF